MLFTTLFKGRSNRPLSQLVVKCAAQRLTTQTFRMASTLPRLPVFEAIAKHDPSSTVVIHSASGRRFTYGQLLHDVAETKDKLAAEAQRDSIEGERIAFLVENSVDYIVTLLSVLGSHAIALPMSPAFPVNELQYIMNQSQAAMLLSSEKFHGKANDVVKSGLETSPILLQLQKKVTAESTKAVQLTETHEGKGGLMLYTSGTTNRPKGVLSPQSVITAQSQSLLQAWNYTSQDHLLHVLPLHHIHGIINAIMTPLLAGSTIEFLFPFKPTSVWNRLAAPYLPDSESQQHISIFTAVPTVYNRLLTTFDSLPPDVQIAAKKGIHPDSLKLNMSGSAALPTPTKKAWEALSSGNVLLERYGMTEVGMALSCALPFASRVDGSVGWPLPFVEARLFDNESQTIIAPGEEVTAEGKERDGEIQLRGPTIFKEYWQNAKATAETFTEDDADGKGPWFKTGDIAVRRHVEGADKDTPEWAKGPMYFISGRASADIIKTGGEKVSALEVERELLGLPEIAEVAVVAVPSGKWGQKVGAVVMLKEGATGKSGKQWAVMDMRRALKDKLANYKIPQVMKVVEKIPRNAMGKINKKELVKAVFKDEFSGDEM